jgi:hypothetical protein
VVYEQSYQAFDAKSSFNAAETSPAKVDHSLIETIDGTDSRFAMVA